MDKNVSYFHTYNHNFLKDAEILEILLVMLGFPFMGYHALIL